MALASSYHQLGVLAQVGLALEQLTDDDSRAVAARTLTNHDGAVAGVTFSPDRRLPATASSDDGMA